MKHTQNLKIEFFFPWIISINNKKNLTILKILNKNEINVKRAIFGLIYSVGYAMKWNTKIIACRQKIPYF